LLAFDRSEPPRDDVEDGDPAMGGEEVGLAIEDGVEAAVAG